MVVTTTQSINESKENNKAMKERTRLHKQYQWDFTQ